MKYSKNIIATVLICGVVSTIGFAAAKSPLWTLDGNVVEVKTDKEGTWVLVPKNFVSGTLVNEDKQGLKLTAENYKKASRVGNTYKDVCRILGGKGKLESSHSASFLRDDDDNDTVADTYVWKKKMKDRVTIRIKFIDEVIENSDDCSYQGCF